MKRIVLAAVAAVGISAAAQAADVPVKGPVYKASPVFNWSGFYVGGTLGYGWGETRWRSAGGATTGDFDTDGVIAGFTLGRNWQVPGSTWVYGLEADISGAQIRGSTVTACGAATPCVSTIEMLATFRGRIGYAKGSTLFYATGGLAVGLVDYFGAGAVNDDTVELGWTAGAGIESVWQRNWSWKVEYLYVDLGRSDVFFVPTGIVAPINRTHVARLGVNYRW